MHLCTNFHPVSHILCPYIGVVFWPVEWSNFSGVDCLRSYLLQTVRAWVTSCKFLLYGYANDRQFCTHFHSVQHSTRILSLAHTGQNRRGPRLLRFPQAYSNQIPYFGTLQCRDKKSVFLVVIECVRRCIRKSEFLLAKADSRILP